MGKGGARKAKRTVRFCVTCSRLLLLLLLLLPCSLACAAGLLLLPCRLLLLGSCRAGPRLRCALLLLAVGRCAAAV
jgi:hypothetical protein